MAIDVTRYSTQLSSYAQWAEGATDKQTAGVNKSGVGTIPGRGISKAQAGQLRQAALDDFKKALTDTVGDTIANQVWKVAGGAKCKGLSASVIKTALSKAGELLGKALVQPKGFLLSGFDNAPQGLIQAAVKNNAFPPDMVKATVAIVQANSLLGMTPITQKQAEIFETRLQDALSRLMDCRGKLGVPKNEVETQRANQLENLIRSLGQKAHDVKTMMDKLPNGAEALNDLCVHWQNALCRACNQLTASIMVKVNPSAKDVDNYNKLTDKLDELKAHCDRDQIRAMLCQNRKKLSNPLVKLVAKDKYDIGKQLDKMLKDAVKTVYKKGALPQEAVSLEKLVSNSHLEQLNTAEWKPIKNQFTGTLNGQTFQLQSEITSGRNIKNTSIRSAYDNNVEAYNSHSQDTGNAVNLATSKLTITDSDGTSRTVFRGVRHGVHSAVGIKGDKVKRAEANVSRARQTVMAAFTTLFETHAKEFKMMAAQGRPIPINLTSVSLLTTPDLVPKERDMLKEQMAAWQSVSNTPMQVTMGNTTYTVVPNVVTFNYGVDKFAVDKFHVGWKASDPINQAGMAAMQNRVDMFLANPKAPQGDREAVSTLWRQIQDITRDHGEHKAEGEAYKVPARLAVMTSLMGDVPCWNCKSGKDRTGMLDVEAKFLATLIAQGQQIPEPGAELDEEQSQLLTTITMKSGNLEMQKYNTGIAGYKLYGGKSTYQRLHADDEAKNVIKGGSSYVGS